MNDAQTRTIHFELVSPEEKLISAPADMVVVPGMDGELGVCAGHASFVVGLKPGVIRMYTESSSDPRRVFIAGGFADVTGELCTVLAESAVNVSEMDRAAIEQDILNLNEDLSLAEEESDKKRIAEKLSFAHAQLRAVIVD